MQRNQLSIAASADHNCLTGALWSNFSGRIVGLSCGFGLQPAHGAPQVPSFRHHTSCLTVRVCSAPMTTTRAVSGFPLNLPSEATTRSKSKMRAGPTHTQQRTLNRKATSNFLHVTGSCAATPYNTLDMIAPAPARPHRCPVLPISTSAPGHRCECRWRKSSSL